MAMPRLRRWWVFRDIMSSAHSPEEELTVRAMAAADPVETARTRLMAMAGSPDAQTRIIALKALVPYDWGPIVDVTLADPDRNVRMEAVACIYGTYARPARHVAIMLAMSILEETEESVLRAKARTLSDLTWGRFAYEDTWTADEIMERVKEFLPQAKAESDRIYARSGGGSARGDGP